MHCTFCGQKFASEIGPLQVWVDCQAEGCKQTTWLSPQLVVVVIVPVEDGVLLIKRAQEPMMDQLAFPGGYAERGESLEQAGCRELFEETGLVVGEKELSYFASRSTLQGKLITFFVGPRKLRSELPPFRPNQEASARVILNEPAFLAFQTHKEMMDRYLAHRDMVA